MCPLHIFVDKCLHANGYIEVAPLELDMGRIDVVLPDQLERQLRMQVASRYGGKKGNLLRAVSEAIELWVASDESKKVAKRLAKTVRDPKTPTGVKEEAVAALAKTGMAGVDLLSEIGADHGVPESIRSQALKAIDFTGRK